VIRRCEFELVAKAVKRSGAADYFEGIIRPGGSTGRPRALSIEVFFAGAVLVADRGLPLNFTNIHRALTEWLPHSLQVQAGLRRKKKNANAGDRSVPITIRQVRYIFEAIEKRLEFTVDRVSNLTDEERSDRRAQFQELIDQLLASSLPQALPRKMTLAFDTSGVESWAKARSGRAGKTYGDEIDLAASRRRRGTSRKVNPQVSKAGNEVLSFDADARRGYRTKTYMNKSNVIFGYDLFGAVNVLPVGADPDLAPRLMVTMALEPLSVSTTEPVLSILDRLAGQGVEVDEILVDRGFSYKTPENWANELRARSISQVQDIHPADHGARDHDGILIIDGVPHCPMTPERLWKITRPARLKVTPLKPNASREARKKHEQQLKEIEVANELIDERQRYAFVVNQRANKTAKDQGKVQYQCPGRAGKLQCSLCPFSGAYAKDTPVVTNPPKKSTAPKGCAQSYLTIPGYATAKLAQKDYWLSEAWRNSYSRRSAIEGIFGNLKSPGSQRIERGFCRVVGLIKTSLMLVIEAIAANIRVLRKWSKRTGDVSDPLCVPMPVNHGFEELDLHGQISLAEPLEFDDPPDEFAA